MMEQKQNGKRIHLIALDLDGTLLSDNKILSAKNQRVLSQAIKKDIFIVPATGRPMAGLPKEILKNKDIKYAICSNGAAVINLKEGKVLHSCYLEQKTVIQIIETLRPLDPILDIFAKGRIFTERRNMKRLDEFLIPDNMISYIYDTRTCVDDILALVKTDKLHIEKVNLFFQNLDMRSQVEAKLKSMPGVSITSSLNNNLEINYKNANKGFGLKWLIKYLGLCMEEVMVCGDSDNDIAMLSAAGLAIAMENGTDAIKCIADAVTLSNEKNGVAVAIEKYVL